ncbi:TrkH family potassium uptake protein [Candidatus Dependentiae bacterium]
MNDPISPDDKPSLQKKTNIAKFSPGRVIISSFLVVISLGTLLLKMPFAHNGAISLLDAFFTSASATCVTGLFTTPISSFSLAGHCVILALIQIGGLGLMTMSFFLASIFLGKLGVAARALASEVLDFGTLGKMKTFLVLIVVTTFGIEFLGAIALFPHFNALYTPGKAIFYAIFYAISAFCNAGITLSDANLIGMENARFVLGVLGILVFAGGLGFAVIYELLERVFAIFKRRSESQSPKRFSLHTRIVLSTSIFLVLGGTTLTWLLEQGGTLANMGLWDSIENAFLHSVWLRSAGFFSVHIAALAPATIFVFIALMMIGASPGSTGGGIKTTTFSLFIATLNSTMHKKNVVEMGGRTIAQDQLNKAIAIVSLTFFWLIFSTFIMLITEPGQSFLKILFESASSLSTTGLSFGITPHLSGIGKLIIVTNMVAGRIGALTLILALRKKRDKKTYRFPEERVLIS